MITELKDWLALSVDERLETLLNWSKYEDYDYIVNCRSVGDFEKLYTWLHFDVGVDFVSEALEEITDDDIHKFNTELGYILI